MHTKNPGVQCSVEQCRYNDHKEYCTLDVIKIGSHNGHVRSEEATDCQSFEVR